jgi:hypothetical protein
MPHGPRQCRRPFDLSHGCPNAINARYNVLDAHAHDQVLWFGKLNLLDRRLEAAEKLPAVFVDLLRIAELRPRSHDVGGVDADAIETGAPRVHADNAPDLVFHARIRRRDQEAEFAPKAAHVGVSERAIDQTKVLRRPTVMDDAGSCKRRHRRLVRIWNDDRSAAEGSNDRLRTLIGIAVS